MSIKNILKTLNTTMKSDIASTALIKKLEYFISSGNSLLDLIASNRRNGGIACSGRITLLGGLLGSGKSLIAGHCIVDIQKKDGIAVLIDTEAAVNTDYLEVIGVDLLKLLIVQCSVLEDVYNIILQLCVLISTEYKNKPALIIVDSLTSTTIAEIANTQEHALSGYNMKKARINSESIKRIQALIYRHNIALIVTSQVRQNIGAPLFAEKYVTSNGGVALQFYASIRVMLKKVGKLKGKINDILRNIGVLTRASISKSRLGPSNLSVDFEIHYDSGIDLFNSWFNFLKTSKLLNGKGTKADPWKLTNNSGLTMLFNKKLALDLANDLIKREFAYNVIADALIMKYKKTHYNDSDLFTVDTENDDDTLLTGKDVDLNND